MSDLSRTMRDGMTSEPNDSPAREDGPQAAAGRPALDAMERLRARDPKALGAFFEDHFDSIYGLVYRLLGDRHVAEDVAQEVFFRAYRAIHRIRTDRDARPWLTTIAYNVCRNHWRSGSHRLARRSVSIHELGSADERMSLAGDDPESDALTRERERIVQETLLDLPEALRTAVVLHDYEGLSHERVAEITGIGHAAARKRHSRAVAELAKRLRGRV